MYTIGIDPGASGAAVVLRDRKAYAAFWWERVQRKGVRVTKFSMADVDGETKVVILHRHSSIGFLIAEYLEASGIQDGQICCEDVYLGRNVKTLIDLARNCGTVVGPIEEYFGLPSTYVAANEWRQVVIGVKRGTKREQVKNAALLLIPSRVDGMRNLLSLSNASTHICDAAGIAEYGRVTIKDNQNGKRKQRPVVFVD
jgi:Holliday junction resolvasome RuvABC endonuclease subunit